MLYSQGNLLRFVSGDRFEPKAKRLEFRAPDPSATPTWPRPNSAGLDGIVRIEPAEPADKDLYELPPEEAANIQQAPRTLAEAIDAPEENHDFLLR